MEFGLIEWGILEVPIYGTRVFVNRANSSIKRIQGWKYLKKHIGEAPPGNPFGLGGRLCYLNSKSELT